jgi:hypothetical protein
MVCDSESGSVDHGPLFDNVLREHKLPGPFSSVASFHSWLSRILDQYHPGSTISYDYFRPLLTDETSVKFTHGDIHRHNILVSLSKPSEVICIVDWAHSGWYPEYWEYFKA